MKNVALLLSLVAGIFFTHVASANFVLESEHAGSIIGEVISDAGASESAAMKAASANALGGTLAFGSLDEDLNVGSTYQASFRMKVSDNSSLDEDILVDIFNPVADARVGYLVLKASDFAAADQYQDFNLSFTQSSADKYEFRVFYSDTSAFDLFSDRVRVDAISTSLVRRYLPNEMATTIGSLVSDTDNQGNTLDALQVTSANQAGGTLQFGPSENILETGKNYKAVFNLKVSDNTFTANKIYIDVFNFDTNHREYLILSPSDFDAPNVYQTFAIPFTRNTEGYEFRVFYYPSAGFDLTSGYTDIYEFTEVLASEAELLLTNIGEVVDDIEASSGQALRVTSDNQLGGILQFGPYESSLVTGNDYTANFRLKVSDNTSEQDGIYIDVYSHGTGDRNYLILKPSDFNSANEYQSFEVPFTRSVEGYEFRVFYFPGANFDLYSDSVTVLK